MSKMDYQGILANLEEELAGVAAERDRLARREAALLKAIAGHRELISLNGGGSHFSGPLPPDEIDIPKNAFQRMEIVAAAVAYLRAVRKGQRNNQLLKALAQGGKHTTAGTLRSVLKRNSIKPESELVKNGELWELKEWFSAPKAQTSTPGVVKMWEDEED